MIKTRFRWHRPVLLTVFALAAVVAVIFGLRTYRSFLLLHSAYEVGAPDVGNVRPWMTLDYVARTYGVPQAALAERLGESSDIDPKTTLRSLARKQRLPPFEYVQQVQQAIAASHDPLAEAIASASRTRSATRSLPRCWSTVIPFLV